MFLRRFYIDPGEIQKDVPAVTGPDARHISKVLRLKKNDAILLIDGTGYLYEAKITGLSDERVEVAVIRGYLRENEPPVRIIVGQGFLKDRKMDLLVRYLTEIGVTGWVPVFTRNAVPRPEAKRLALRVERWKTIAREAAKQCRRSLPPDILDPVTFDELLEMEADLKIVFWENETKARLEKPPVRTALTSIMVLLGPEGGFTENEIRRARLAGFATASLGPRILRAETAALAACTLIQHIYGDM